MGTAHGSPHIHVNNEMAGGFVGTASEAEGAIQEFLEIAFVPEFHTMLVVLSTLILGAAAGMIGTFLLLRKQSLMGDALSHATLPGIGIAFMVMVAFGGSGKNMPGLLIGAAVFGLVGAGSVLFITRNTRLKSDAALGIVLSVYFGLGVALLGIIQQMPTGSAAGLNSFIYGKPSTVIIEDLYLIAGVALAVTIVCTLLFKELALLCFDECFASAQGWPITRLDASMLALATAVLVIGLQAVGLILVIAMLIIPPAAARFWTEKLKPMMIGSAVIGALSGWFGAVISAMATSLPAGAVIVLMATTIFLFSMIFGSSRGILKQAMGQYRLRRKIGHQHLLRACYESLESRIESVADEVFLSKGSSVTFDSLLSKRSWSPKQLRRLIQRSTKSGDVTSHPSTENEIRLTSQGLREGARLVRNHRLWEIYLITHADIAPSHVDRDADQIEHVLDSDLIERLEQLLDTHGAAKSVPASPHELNGGAVS